MQQPAQRAPERPTSPGAIAPSLRILARGEGWRVSDYLCHSGPMDRPFEEHHDEATIAAVISGTFQYRTGSGSALLYPGSFVLGNAGDSFECRHEHGTGDRCIAFHLAPCLFEEIAATAAGSHRFRFPAAMLAASRALTVPGAAIAATAAGADAAQLGELTIGVAETVLKSLSGTSFHAASASARDQRRISNVLRHIEAHAAEPLNLDGLANVAAMSKYHFLRTFRRIVSTTPYEYLIRVRMRRAALLLCTTPASVASIAFDAGFGDLSTFNSRFRTLFGATPRAYRAMRRKRAPC